MTEVAIPVKPAQVKALPIRLTAEEEKSRYEFIGKCVDRGINFPGTNKFGVQGALSVQDICTSNVKTLADIAIKVKKANDDHDPEFMGTEALKLNGVPAEEWLNFFRLTIRKKNYNVYLAERRDKMKELNETIKRAMTPEESRRLAELELQALKTELGPDTELV